MVIPTVPVTITLAKQSGQPLAGVEISAMLSRNELFNGLIVPNQQVTTTDAAGVAVLSLFPNQLGSQSSQYIFRLTGPSGKTLSLVGTVPNAPCTLESIVTLPASPAAPIGQVAVDTAIAAMAAASVSAAQALAAAASISSAASSFTLTAGEQLGGHRAVRVHTDSKAYYADNTTPLSLHSVVGITSGAASSDDVVTVVTSGRMSEPSWTWTLNAPIFLSTMGLLTQTPPTSGIQRIVGIPFSATELFIQQQPPLQL